MTAAEELLQHNRSKLYRTRTGSGRPMMAVTMMLCMAARVDAHAAFGKTPGEAHLIQNAGGVVTTASSGPGPTPGTPLARSR